MILNGVDFQSSLFIQLCQSHKIKEFYVFGSILNYTFSNRSDIDVLVEIDETDPIKKGLLLLSLIDALEKHFNRKVDLLTLNSLRNPYLAEAVNNSKKLVFDGSKEEVLL